MFLLGILLVNSIVYGADPPEVKLADTHYYDVETNTSSAVLNASHDFQCAGSYNGLPVNIARKQNKPGESDNFPLIQNKSNVIGYVWSLGQMKFASGAQTKWVYLATTEGNYTRLHSNTFSAGFCEFTIDYLSTTPYFDGTTAPSTYEITLASWTGDSSIYFSHYDLGIFGGEWVGASLNYRGITNELYPLNSTTYHLGSTDDSSTDRMTTAQCFSDSAYDTNTVFTNLNGEGDFDVFCFNSTIANRPYIGAFMLLNHPSNNGEFRAITFNADYFTVAGTTHSPLYPAPNMSVRIIWDTTQEADSRIFWRTASVNNITNLTGWNSLHDSTLSMAHSITINKTYIFDNTYYQYWVQSNRTGTEANDTNNGLYFNFSVGRAGLPIYGWDELPPGMDENMTAPVFRTGTSNLAKIWGVPEIDIVNMFAVFMLIILTVAGLWFTHNPAVGVAIFIVGVALFSLFGWLPYYLFIIIAVVFAFGMALFIKKIMD